MTRLFSTGVVVAVAFAVVGFAGLVATWAIEDATSASPPKLFPSDDRGFIRGEQGGRYEYLGVRLSDAAVLRTEAQSATTRSYPAQKAGVLYAVPPTELKVTSGDTVIKREPMISYREVRQ